MAAKKSEKGSVSKKTVDKKEKTKKSDKKDKIKKDEEKDSAKKDSAKKSKKKDTAKKSGKKDGVKKADKKDSDKKAKTKKGEKKDSAKKGGAKKVSSKKVSKESRDRIVIDPISPLNSESSQNEIVPTLPSSSLALLVASQEFSERKAPIQSKKSFSRVVLAVIAGVILIAIFGVVINHNNSTIPKSVTPTATPSSVVTPSPSSSPTEITTAPASPSAATPTPTTSTHDSPPAIPSTTDLSPVGISAYFNSTGATIIWRADKNAIGITAYSIEKSSNGGNFKFLAKVPATQHSLNVTETDTNGWSSFKVSAVYSDGAVVAGKVFGLPSQYS